MIEQYPIDEEIMLDDVNEYLTARWYGDRDYPQTALRPLTEWFNKRLLKLTYGSHGLEVVDRHIDADYEALTSEDPSDRAPLTADPLLHEIDLDQVTADFVSPSTMYRHFTQCLDLDSPEQPSDGDSNWEVDSIRHSRSVITANIADVLSSLEKKGTVRGASEATVETHVVLGCPHCSNKVRLSRALDQGHVCETHFGDD